MSLVDQVRKLEQQVVDRLRELEPLTREYNQLRKVAERLGLKYTPGSAKSDEGRSRRRRGAARPSRRPSAQRASRQRCRPCNRAAAARRSRLPSRAARDQPPRRRQRRRPTATAGENGHARASAQARRCQPATVRRTAAAARPGQRHEDVLRLVGENPGITVREIGERLGVDATGLYRVVNQLTDEGRVRKDGTGLQPVDTTTTSEPKPAATTDTAKQAPPAAGTEAPAKEPEPSTAVAASAPSDDS